MQLEAIQELWLLLVKQGPKELLLKLAEQGKSTRVKLLVIIQQVLEEQRERVPIQEVLLLLPKQGPLELLLKLVEEEPTKVELLAILQLVL